MKSFFTFKFVIHFTILTVFISSSMFGNSLTGSEKNSVSVIENEYSKKDSLPEGVTQDWLNSLKDENGNRIISQEDPEGDAFQSKIFNGLGTGYRHGYSLSSAGDVNADGYDDIIVGAYSYSSNTGRAYIFYGGQNMNTTADVVMTGEASSSNFGYSVSSAGDVNGDGFSDVIVGAYGYSSNNGRAYIYYGGNTMNNVIDLTLTILVANISFGYSVSKAGDVNGDGFSDVIVGVPGYTSNTGRAYIYYGGNAMNVTADVLVTGEAINNFFGSSVSSGGDVNGDGYEDVIIGAYGYSSNTGRAYIYHGGASMNSVADLVLTGETINNFFGSSVSSAGDVNGDGFSDVIVGANGNSSNQGKAYIYIGGSSMSNTAFHQFAGENSNNLFGYSVSSAGDVNGDGYSDVIVSAIAYNSQTGRAYVYFGGTSMKSIADAVKTGSSSSENFGRSVASAGDVNGDGYSDIIVGAEGYNASSGRAYLFDYYMKNDISPEVILTAETEYNAFGRSASTAGDVNGDGFNDVIVGAYTYNTLEGRAYIYYGGVLMDNTADVTISGGAGSESGYSVSAAGDLNADGYSDVIVGRPGYNSDQGRAYIYYGGAVMNNSVDVILTGGAVGDRFGESVSVAGDVNGDGYSDVIVGAKNCDTIGVNAGRAYIYYGGLPMNNTADKIFTGEVTGDNFGISVSAAGDVNGDGFDDMIIGADNNDVGGSNAGRAYIYLGGETLYDFPFVTFTGSAAGYFLGVSVSSAGDVNGDGFNDVIVGANGYSTSTGRAYIYYGGMNMNSSANVTLTGNSTFDYFGESVSSAGDINGDGYNDVIVSARNNDEAGNSAGKAYIYFGSSSMNNVADVTMKGDSIGDTFGYSVSSAGDVNGDGYSDVIVGSPGNDAAGTSAGSSYIYTGSVISVQPIFNHVKDVPNDQGGKVNLKWARSSYDVNGIDKISDYYVEISNPPSGGNFAWMPAATVPAVKNSFYSININTPYDSSANSTGNFYFRITARTSNPSEYWRSGILFGRSIDNIAPLMVSPFTAASASGNVNLNWGASQSTDILNYILYRNTSSIINPETEPVFATTTNTSFLDTSPLTGNYFYFIAAQDIHNNKSPVALVNNPGMRLNLILYIEGFYNAGSNSQISDTVSIELRNPTSPFALADKYEGAVGSNGLIKAKFTNAPDGNYYFVVKHRNGIETWNASPLAFSLSAYVEYNISTSSAQSFGNNQIQVDASPLRFAIYSGDVNQDGTIDLTDGSLIDNDAFNFAGGYLPTDVNGDQVIDLADAVFADNNGFNFISKITP